MSSWEVTCSYWARLQRLTMTEFDLSVISEVHVVHALYILQAKDAAFSLPMSFAFYCTRCK